MNTKSKLFSLLLIGLLLAPVLFIAPQSNQGEVLGESDVAGEISPSLPAEIGSGVREVREDSDSAESLTQKTISGTIIWDENQAVDVATNKFSLGKSIQLETPSGTYDLVINAIRPELADETLMIVNRETFIRLGGDPDTDPNLPGTAWDVQ